MSQINEYRGGSEHQTLMEWKGERTYHPSLSQLLGDYRVTTEPIALRLTVQRFQYRSRGQERHKKSLVAQLTLLPSLPPPPRGGDNDHRMTTRKTSHRARAAVRVRGLRSRGGGGSAPRRAVCAKSARVRGVDQVR